MVFMKPTLTWLLLNPLAIFQTARLLKLLCVEKVLSCAPKNGRMIFSPPSTRAQEKMQRQIERFKGKRHHGRGDGASAAEVIPEEVTPEVSEPRPVIARRKEFELVPMDEMEALDQMVLLGHENFFIFYNANTSKINVLYRRRDGTYGLIEPKVG